MRNAENPLETGPGSGSGSGSESAPRRANELVDELGKITFTEPVLSALVHQAVSRIEDLDVSVVGEGKGKLGDLAGVFGGRQKGVHVELRPEGVHVTMTIAVRYGQPIHEVARRIQRRVKEEVEGMTGLTVAGVDIYVQAIQPPQPPAEEEPPSAPERAPND